MSHDEKENRGSLPTFLEEHLASLIDLDAEERARELAQLKEDHPELTSLLDRWEHEAAALAPGSGLAGDSSAQPDRIGPYRILGVLGEGGMGTVYIAEQRSQLARRVALKVIKLGMDSKAVTARFEQERQALAVMEHDGIAKVYDCGTSERGQPYFVMELVKGVPLTEFCKKNRLPLEDRLKLIRQVCIAVAHAHQKGIVHRDLKPSNVLVIDDGGTIQIKIIDFGLAKAMGPKLVEASIYTEVGQVVGSPEYLAPEQADSTNQDIDARADVYSLGVMLYEVLVEELPFSTKDLRSAGILEMLRVLREVDPVKPSARLTSMGDASRELAQAQRSCIASLRKALKNDLDWVVLKALEKDRNRRYDTANALAADLDRYLSHEPLSAGPPGAGYRLKKLLRRYRGQVLVGCAVVLALIGGALAFEAWEAKRFAQEPLRAFQRYAQAREAGRTPDARDVEALAALYPDAADGASLCRNPDDPTVYKQIQRRVIEVAAMRSPTSGGNERLLEPRETVVDSPPTFRFEVPDVGEDTWSLILTVWTEGAPAIHSQILEHTGPPRELAVDLPPGTLQKGVTYLWSVRRTLEEDPDHPLYSPDPARFRLEEPSARDGVLAGIQQTGVPSFDALVRANALLTHGFVVDSLAELDRVTDSASRSERQLALCLRAEAALRLGDRATFERLRRTALESGGNR